jgi:hypothetical protein
MHKNFRGLACVAVVAALTATEVHALSPGAKLSTCQKTVDAESAKYVRSVSGTIGKCLGAMSGSVIRKGASTSAAAAAAVAGCTAGLRKLVNTAEPASQLSSRLAASIDFRCDPTVNPELPYPESATWTVGASTLGAANLGAYCEALGGDGTIDSFTEWRECLLRTAVDEANEAVAMRYPRALEYFEALAAALDALPVGAETTDAKAALAALDAAIEGPVDDNLPDPRTTPPALLATGETQTWFSGCAMSCMPPNIAGMDYEPACGLDCWGFQNQDGRVRAGYEANLRDNGDGTVTDEVTGLVWEKLVSDGSLHDVSFTYDFADAVTGKIAGLNSGVGFAGRKDWRLPNRRELESLVVAWPQQPAVDPAFNEDCELGCTALDCSCTATERYWTSTSYQADASKRWVVDFGYGDVKAVGAESLRVRAVRGGAGVAAATTSGDGGGKSLAACQQAVAKESAKYVRGVTATFGKCLQKMSALVIKNGATPAVAAAAAGKSCVAALGKLTSPEKGFASRFTDKVAAKCDTAFNPALEHDDAATWTIGERTLGAGNLASLCAALGGNGLIGSFDDWSACLLVAADAEARQAVTIRWPRALEYLSALSDELATLPPAADKDAAAALLAGLEQQIEGPIDDNQPDPVPAPPAGLLATGQTQCAQADSTMGTCPGALPGDDGEVRAGQPRRYTDNGDGTITDHATGLMWEKLGDDDSVNDKDHIYSVYQITMNKVGRLNRGQFAGYDDWRAPNRRELESLVDAGRSSPAIDPIFNHDCTPGCSEVECSCTSLDEGYASVTISHAPPGQAEYWGVQFGDGTVNVDSPARHVRAVRGGYRPFPAYVNQPSTALDASVKHPWKYSCVPVTFLGSDLDSSWAFLVLDTFPEHGFITEFISSIADCQGGDGPCIFPPGVDMNTSFYSGGGLASTKCYVSFSDTFTGTDSLTYHWLDADGTHGSTGLMTITIFEE